MQCDEAHSESITHDRPKHIGYTNINMLLDTSLVAVRAMYSVLKPFQAT
jgi:hypothetical protein